MAKRRVSSSFARSISFTLCLALIFSSLPLAASTQNQTPETGFRTQGPPSPNVPNIDAIRSAQPKEEKLPPPTRAKRCRHHDKKCKELKEKKAENRLAPANDFLKGLIAHNRSRAFLQGFDWRTTNAGLLPELDLLLNDALRATANSTEASESNSAEDFNQNLPRAFASSLAPVTALQVTNFETARMDAHNRTGAPGEDLFSGNFNWTLPLVSLPGRSGHDLNLTLSYNSLVWLKSGSYMRFDPDYGWPSPGFRLGFPTFVGPYVNSLTNRVSYQLITPSGSVVELRQINSVTWDAEDSSYTRLSLNGSGNYLLTTADGTQYIYGDTLEIKDRNGNRIIATYTEFGLINTITDTLGRVITFNYGEFYELLSITQVWNGVTKTLAAFHYADQAIYTNFPGLYLDNVTNGQLVPVVYQIDLLDGSRYMFQYNTYAQVTKFERYRGQTSNPTLLRSWISYNLPANAQAGAQTDCPRFTQRTDMAYDWNAGVNTSFCFSDPATSCKWIPNHPWGKVTTPDGTEQKQFFAMTGWQRGLPTTAETWAGGIKKKWTTLEWEQACAGTYYPCNPRVYESNIYDDTDGNGTADNRRRVTTSFAGFNLPFDVYEYDSNATTVLRRTRTEYNLTTTYTNRRIIGLPSRVTLYDGASVEQSKVEFFYDESGYLQVTSSTPTGHDSTNYGIGFVAGRGNQTTVRRYDVTNQSYVDWKTGYNITGSPIFSRDPLYGTTGAQATLSYDDKWVNASGNDAPNLNTFAYPTTITDQENNSTTIKYNFDIGAVRRTINPKGASVLHEYDGYGRRWRTTNEVNGAYTYFTFDSLQSWIASYSTIEAGQGEFLTVTTFDGHDRVRGVLRDHPGSAGGYSAQYFFYDTMGRAWQQSNPTETNANWIPTGDDAAGWAWSLQTYDWQGRPLASTDTLGKTKQFSYAGCGCAGSDVTTITDEGTVITNGGGQPEAKKRQQKIFRDVIGRVFKTQILNWEGGSPYSTTITAYNVRDQITSVKEYSGNANGTENCPTATCQITNMTYDGHGRLWKQRRPIETADNVYLYSADDTLWKHTDPRNVTATYSYNNRKLATGITFDSMPNAALPSPLPSRPIPSANVTFGYDQVGNRTWMDDAPGRVDYVYDQLDRLKEETRLFDASAVSRSFTLKYEYNLAGQLKQITDPWNAVINYNMDKSGQETGITATGYKDVNQWTNRTVGAFASNIKYRAWGGIKQFSNGTLSGNSSFAMGYDARLRLTSFTGGNRTTQHSYYDDGLVKEVTDLHYGGNFLRKYEYDHVSQLKKAHAGGTAQTSSSPYSLTYGYDVWGHTTSRTGSHWSNTLTAFSTTFTNDRDNNMTFDAAGNVKGYSASYNDPYMHYNATSQLFTQFESGTLGLVRVRENYYDGDGAKVFYKTFNGSLNNGSYSLFCDYFLIRSSVLGGRVLAEFKDLTTYAENDPLKYSSKSYVYLKGVQLGFQMDAHKATGDKFVVWMYHNPTVGNYFAEYQLNNSGGQQLNFPYGEMTFDPIGSFVGLSEPQPIDVPSSFTFVMGQFMEASTGKCYADYVETRCEVVQQMLNNGTGAHAPLDPYTTDSNNRLNRITFDWDNGFYGFVPTGANYHGDGTWSWANPRNGRPTLKPKGQARSGGGYGSDGEADGVLQQLPVQLPNNQIPPIPIVPFGMPATVFELGSPSFCNPIFSGEPSGEALDFIRGFEAFSSTLYNDAAGHCTIGFGHLIHRGNCTEADTQRWGRGISREQGINIFTQDVGVVTTQLNNLVIRNQIPLTQPQFDALVSFTFNFNITMLANSTLFRHLQNLDHEAASNEFPRWINAGNPPRPLRGLERRRAGEREMFNRPCP